ncbi:hypothetical protein L3X38_018025 [Prunus dulcis]|uniref:Uncharacterized protein n=1 Tax=Prunus dulcis TaxID=3755 RepID=A0AAD4ZB96_PRUDU|nr:hypothetical protein L3X38_018025 [Prunus dulcis]
MHRMAFGQHSPTVVYLLQSFSLGSWKMREKESERVKNQPTNIPRVDIYSNSTCLNVKAFKRIVANTHSVVGRMVVMPVQKKNGG